MIIDEPQVVDGTSRRKRQMRDRLHSTLRGFRTMEKALQPVPEVSSPDRGIFWAWYPDHHSCHSCYSFYGSYMDGYLIRTRIDPYHPHVKAMCEHRRLQHLPLGATAICLVMFARTVSSQPTGWVRFEKRLCILMSYYCSSVSKIGNVS